MRQRDACEIVAHGHTGTFLIGRNIRGAVGYILGAAIASFGSTDGSLGLLAERAKDAFFSCQSSLFFMPRSRIASASASADLHRLCNSEGGREKPTAHRLVVE